MASQSAGRDRADRQVPLVVHAGGRLVGKERSPADGNGAAGLALPLEQDAEVFARHDRRLDGEGRLQSEERQAVFRCGVRLEFLVHDDGRYLGGLCFLQIGAAIEDPQIAGAVSCRLPRAVDGAVRLGDQPIRLQQHAAAVLVPALPVGEALDGDDAGIEPLRRLQLRRHAQGVRLLALQSTLCQARRAAGERQEKDRQDAARLLRDCPE